MFINYINLNIKPVPFLIITQSFGIHSGLPKKIYTGKTYMIAANLDEEILELYTRNKEYSDTKRTLPSFPFSLKITFQHYFPKSKVKFEAYAAVDNIFQLFYNPYTSIEIDKYTGEEIETSTSLDFEIFTPSAGIKINF